MISNQQRPTSEQIVSGAAENYLKKYLTRSRCIMKFTEAIAEVYFIMVRDCIEYFTKLSWLLRVTECYIVFVTWVLLIRKQFLIEKYLVFLLIGCGRRSKLTKFHFNFKVPLGYLANSKYEVPLVTFVSKISYQSNSNFNTKGY